MGRLVHPFFMGICECCKRVLLLNKWQGLCIDGGVDVAKMDAKLLQKIEELNLYVIQLEKENKRQDAEIEELLKMVKN